MLENLITKLLSIIMGVSRAQSSDTNKETFADVTKAGKDAIDTRVQEPKPTERDKFTERLNDSKSEDREATTEREQADPESYVKQENMPAKDPASSRDMVDPSEPSRESPPPSPDGPVSGAPVPSPTPTETPTGESARVDIPEDVPSERAAPEPAGPSEGQNLPDQGSKAGAKPPTAAHLTEISPLLPSLLAGDGTAESEEPSQATTVPKESVQEKPRERVSGPDAGVSLFNTARDLETSAQRSSDQKVYDGGNTRDASVQPNVQESERGAFQDAPQQESRSQGTQIADSEVSARDGADPAEPGSPADVRVGSQQREQADATEPSSATMQQLPADSNNSSSASALRAGDRSQRGVQIAEGGETARDKAIADAIEQGNTPVVDKLEEISSDLKEIGALEPAEAAGAVSKADANVDGSRKPINIRDDTKRERVSATPAEAGAPAPATAADGSRQVSDRVSSDVAINPAAAAAEPSAPVSESERSANSTREASTGNEVSVGGAAGVRKLTGVAELVVDGLPIGTMELALEETD